MAFTYNTSFSGYYPTMNDYTSGGALAKGIAVGLQAGKLVLCTGATTGAISCIGITQKAATAADQSIPVILAGPSDIFETTGSAALTEGVSYDTSTDGTKLQQDDTTNPKFKVIGSIRNGVGTVVAYKVVNVSFGLAGSTAS